MGILRQVDTLSGVGGVPADVLELNQQATQLLVCDKPTEETAHPRRYALLLCVDDSDHVRRWHGGYFGVYTALLAEEGERWDEYSVSRGQFPLGWGEDEKEDDRVQGREARRLASLDLYNGFVVTGSPSDAHGDEPWIGALVALLRAACGRGRRVLGICFGHQVLCRALGGRTGRCASGGDIGVTTVNFNHYPQHQPEEDEEEYGASWPRLRSLPSSLSVIECHRDEVLELPPGAEALAWSEKTGVEAFRYGDVAMGIQGHPEYTQDILVDIIERLLQQNIIQISHANAARDSLRPIADDREAWKLLCNSFLKGQTNEPLNLLPGNPLLPAAM